jgi:DNA-binding CsgD family transcriptional regulator/PAS domain-containing protein
MEEAEQLSKLIGHIYDAAVDPAQWSDALARVRDFVGGSAAALFAKDAARKTLDVYYDDGGLDPHYKQLYFDKYAKLDPSTTGHVFADIGQPISTANLIPLDEFSATRFYKEWAQPQGLVDFVCAVLDKSATGAAMFGVFRHERNGLVDDETRRRMHLVVPHIRRAVLVSRAIDLKTAEAAAFADVLDGLTAGMFLVNEAGRIIHANASGHAMLAERSVLRAAGGRLAAVEAYADAALSEIFSAAHGGDAAVGIRGIAVPLGTPAGEPYVAHVLPLTSGARRRAGASSAAVAALFAHKATLEAASPPEAIAKLYKLTPSELRVLLAIVQVGGVPETAEALGVAEATVKTHLHRLFGKTGATRQADLVKLVAGFANPLLAERRRLAPPRTPIGGRNAA